MLRPGTNKLFVGGLPQNTAAAELREHFEVRKKVVLLAKHVESHIYSFSHGYVVSDLLALQACQCK